MHHDGFGQSSFGEKRAKDARLRHGARISVQQETVGAVRLGDTAGHDVVHQFVAHQTAFGHNRGNGLAQFRTGFTFRAEHLAGGNSRYVKTPRKENSLRTFATSGRSEKQEYHDNFRLTGIFSKVNSDRFSPICGIGPE